jgi:phosphinothricin acetyltransferase
VGWATSGRFRPKAAYDRTVETTVYVDPAHVGRGHGARLYDALLAAMDEEGVHRCVAAIALPNPGSVALHQRFGYRPVGVLSEVGFKLGRWVDVQWWERPAP